MNSRIALFLILAGLLRPAAADGEWRQGRTTWFDVENEDLTTANCHLRWDQINTGRYVAAFSDTAAFFSSSCGMCIEVRCQPSTFKDGYGATLDRQGACYDPAKSIFITVADACPCHYPNNANSNSRWCCGDDSSREHIDITRPAFQALADLKWGVIGLEWRIVDCSSVRSEGNWYADKQAQPQAQSQPQDQYQAQPQTSSSYKQGSSSSSSSSGSRGGGWFSRWFGRS